MIQALLFLTFLFFADAAPAIPSFPGAQGGGAVSVGGRGGQVIEVVNTSDGGTGSLRACVQAAGPRTCVFRTGGTIDVTSTMTITTPFLTIAGQTAPGGGIQLRGKGMPSDVLVILDTHDIVIRYLRVRKGFNASSQGQGGSNIRMNRVNNMVFDHISAVWNQDEGFGITTANNVTFSWNIAGEAVGQSGQGHHTTWGILGKQPDTTITMTNIDFLNNLTMNNSNRNPLLRNRSSRVVNNLFYNLSLTGPRASGSTSVDMIGNKYKRGPLGGWGSEMGAWQGYPERSVPGPPSVYLQGNVGFNQSNPSGDQWVMIQEVSGESGGFTGPMPTGWRRGTPMAAIPYPITAIPVTSVEGAVLPIVGASRRLDCNGNWVDARDNHDDQMVLQYQNNTGTSTLFQNEAQYGGYPVLAAGTPCPDADHDGMPDQWETANGLNPNNAADRNGVQSSGFTNLEIYLAGTGGTAPPEPPVPQAPSVSITAPPNGATSTGSVTVTADASDDASVLGVQFRLDGVNLGAEDTTSPYSVVWNTTTASEGAHTLTAVARDAVPNFTTSAPVTVTVDNIGAVAKFDIGDRVEVNNGAITVRTQPTEGGSAGTSLGNQPVGVQGTVLAGPITASNGATYWQINYDTGVDGWSAEQFLDDATTGPGNTSPTVSLTAPANGATVSGSVTVAATASDPGGAVLGVQFLLDGVPLGAEDTSSPYSIVWDSSSATDGTHQIGAVARDSGGATASVGGHIVTVTNTGVCP